ncbi:MAG: hypothetical protein P1U88_06235 [Thalassobaculaceae bacterium]|nr:hypothetical protein [Thalassobaculaceae bacterium]
MPPGAAPNPVAWLADDDVAADFALPPGVVPAGRMPVAPARILVFVGLTGAGKSATVSGLAARGAVHAVLPDRRVLTDRIILPAITGDPARRITDRIERFRLTAAFRDRHPGGMGDVLAHLSLAPAFGTQWSDENWLVFDGVRGPAETTAAARLPNAIFAVLQASVELRVVRLSLRGDPFDQAALEAAVRDGNTPPGGQGDSLNYVRVLTEQGVNSLVAAPKLQRLGRLLADAGADLTSVASAASIVVEESRHYDPREALAVLERVAPGRVVIVDTAVNGVDDVVATIAARLSQSG